MPSVEIRVKGRIDESWSEWLADLTIRHAGRDETVLAGAVADSSALYRVLARLCDLDLPIVSVR